MRSLGTAVAAVLLLIGTALSAPALADDDWDDDDGWRRHGEYREKWKHNHRGFKHEWSDGRCRYEVKRTRKGWKEERSCRNRPAYHWSGWREPHWGYRAPRGSVTWVDPGYALPPPPQTHGRTWGEPYRADSGRFCREYQTEGWIGGRLERLYGTACLTEGGDWEFVR